jgi:hypothetical protein
MQSVYWGTTDRERVVRVGASIEGKKLEGYVVAEDAVD